MSDLNYSQGTKIKLPECIKKNKNIFNKVDDKIIEVLPNIMIICVFGIVQQSLVDLEEVYNK